MAMAQQGEDVERMGFDRRARASECCPRLNSGNAVRVCERLSRELAALSGSGNVGRSKVEGGGERRKGLVMRGARARRKGQLSCLFIVLFLFVCWFCCFSLFCSLYYDF